jgi:hypothetical protein
MIVRRHVLLAGISPLPFALGGCAGGPAPAEPPQRTYCLQTIRLRRTVCTPEPIPPRPVELEAKRFQPERGVLTLYIVRRSWVDKIVPITISVDGVVHIGTLPDSLIRLRVMPGEHEIAFERDGKDRRHRVRGGGGEVLFVELAGSSWPLHPTYRWSDADPAGARERAQDSRLVADLRLGV